MIIEFRIDNYKSIGEEQIMCLKPARDIANFPENVFAQSGEAALNVIALYGGNSSGKSNFLEALSVMDYMVSMSARFNSISTLPYLPFELKDDLLTKPTKMEVVLSTEGSVYKYGFLFNHTAILKEWLFLKQANEYIPLFMREGDVVDVEEKFSDKQIIVDSAIASTKDNCLFLSMADSFNLDHAKAVMSCFNKLNVIDELETESQRNTTAYMVRSNYKSEIEKYMASLGVNLAGLKFKFEDKNDSSTSISVGKMLIEAVHQTYNSDGTKAKGTRIWAFKHESAGTKKSLELSGPIVWALKNGGTLVVDEIEASLHPVLTLTIIEMFLNSETNPKQAQLIFATHDTNLLSYSNLRSDQIYFAEKNNWECTQIFSLSDFIFFKDELKERVIAKNERERKYIEGRFGAIPVLGDFRKFIKDQLWQNQEN